MKRVLIVIVNYRTGPLVVDCLWSLSREEEVADWKVVVVDNASGDDSVETIGRAVAEQGWAAWAEVLPLDNNPGFAGGNNAALEPALAAANPPDYVLLLNPDTVVRPGAVHALVEFLDAHPQAGIAGSRLEDPDGTPQRSAFRFPTGAGEFESTLRLGLATRLLHRAVIAPPVQDAPHTTEWVAGASMLVRREVFDSIGLLDEEFFLYFEEVDFCLRAVRAGWECWYVPASRVVHLVGQSTGVTDTRRPPRRRPAYWFASRRRYFHKHHSYAYAAWVDVAWLAGFSLWQVRRALQRKPAVDPPHLLADFIQHHYLTRPPEVHREYA